MRTRAQPEKVKVMPSPRPKRASVKRAEMNPGKRKLPENEPQPAVEMLKKPENLGKFGEEVWDELGHRP